MNNLALLVASPRSLFGLRSTLAILLAAFVLAPRLPAADSRARSRSSNWLTFNGGYDGARYSELTQITPRNVANLDVLARYRLPETGSFQSGIVAVDGTLYFTTVNTTYAIDARTGKVRWTHTEVPKSGGIGTPVRGVAYADGRIFRGTMDARLLALDAATGNVLWNVPAADAAKGEYFTAAPIVWRDRIYLGNSGSDIGVIGHIMAFDVKDGRKIWNWDNVPAKGSSDPAASTWPSDEGKIRAGGGTYSTYALDPETGTLYTPTGNPGPDFYGEYRPGANLYTCSVLALDAATGALRGFHQFVPHDVHDWDIAASPILFTSKAGRKMVAVAGKNGLLYGLDRELKTVFFQVPVCTIQNADAPITPEGTHFFPGTQGGVNWNGPAYSPATNALYVPARDAGATVKLGDPATLEHKVGTPFIGSANAFGDDDKEMSGWLTSVDADTGVVRWKYHAARPLVAAVTPTAGGLVLTGDLDGNLLALDAGTGEVLLKKGLGDPIGGAVITYALDGQQYVAVAVGMKNVLMKTDSGPASIAILKLR